MRWLRGLPKESPKKAIVDTTMMAHTVCSGQHALDKVVSIGPYPVPVGAMSSDCNVRRSSVDSIGVMKQCLIGTRKQTHVEQEDSQFGMCSNDAGTMVCLWRRRRFGAWNTSGRGWTVGCLYMMTLTEGDWGKLCPASCICMTWCGRSQITVIIVVASMPRTLLTWSTGRSRAKVSRLLYQ